MTYDDIESLLKYKVLARATQEMPDGDEYRLLLLDTGNGYSTYEYQTLGFPPPNDPDNTERWLRNAREEIEKCVCTRTPMIQLLKSGYYENEWGGTGGHFVNVALEALGG